MNWIDRHKLFDRVHKVRSIIKSCETRDQLNSAKRMANNLISQQLDCDEKHVANCMLIGEVGNKLIDFIERHAR